MKIGLSYTGSECEAWELCPLAERRDDEAIAEVVRLSADGGLGDMEGCGTGWRYRGVRISIRNFMMGAGSISKSPETGWQTERDLFAQAVLQIAWERGLPVLGVCRGLQLINVSCGGTLVQDLGVQGEMPFMRM